MSETIIEPFTLLHLLTTVILQIKFNSNYNQQINDVEKDKTNVVEPPSRLQQL